MHNPIYNPIYRPINPRSKLSWDVPNFIKDIGIDPSDYMTSNPDGSRTITSQGLGTLGAGIGALGGALLPSQAPWWKRLLYSLVGAGLIGGGGYIASKHLDFGGGKGKGLTFGGSGAGDTPST